MSAFTLPLLSLLAVAALAGLALWRLRWRRRQRAVGSLLDAADALEARLRAARTELEAIAPGQPDPVREAMQQLLRQRLWLQAHGQGASLGQLQAVQHSLEDARLALDLQLRRIEQARMPTHPGP